MTIRVCVLPDRMKDFAVMAQRSFSNCRGSFMMLCEREKKIIFWYSSNTMANGRER